MTSDKFNDSLNSLLNEGRINHVIKVLRRNCESALASHPDMIHILTALPSLEETYARMRQYLLDGYPDPERERLYDSIKARLKELGRRYLFILNEERRDPYFTEYRLQKIQNTSLAHLLSELDKNDYRIDMARETEGDPTPFMRKKEVLIESFFNKIWSLPPWAEEDRRELEKILMESNTSFELNSQAISALMLGLLKFYDPAKFKLLLEAYENYEDERLSARALTAIVIVLSRWKKSALADVEVEESLGRIADSILTYTRLREIVMTMVRTFDTDRVSREVKDAFNTTMKEISPEMLEKLQKEGMGVDSVETGMNPEWEKLMKNKELEKKMQSINDMQLEGMDVMMQTFSRLKAFGFFRSVANWFLPFSTQHSVTEPLFRTFDKEGFMAMADATEMCDGDRYSFVLGIMQMPEDKRNLLAASIGASLEQIRDHVKDRHNVRKKSLFASEALAFARDIYRFSKLYPRHREFFDPFEKPLDFLNLPILSSLLSEEEIINKIADFYFQNGYYPFALSLYEKAVASGEADRELYEKIGYCYQMGSDFASALQNYEKADLFSSDADKSSTWLLKKLALANKALGNYDKAAEYYKKLLDRNPEDLRLEFQLASVLLRAGEIKSAREIISKVHYLDPSHKHCDRIYTRLKGHDAYLNQNYREAIENYEKARGEQEIPDYHRDLARELLLLDPEADTETLKILLDSED